MNERQGKKLRKLGWKHRHERRKKVLGARERRRGGVVNPPRKRRYKSKRHSPETPPVTSREIRTERRAKGLCPECGEDKHHAGKSPYRSLCLKCQERWRKWKRKRYGYRGNVKGHEGVRGVKPLVSDRFSSLVAETSLTSTSSSPKRNSSPKTNPLRNPLTEELLSTRREREEKPLFV